MNLLRDAILKELQRVGGDDFHVSTEFFANVRSLCTEHASMERRWVIAEKRLVEARAALALADRKEVNP